jgi:hypothetical protein
VHPVRGLYTYQASGADELDVEEGDIFELSAGPNGGRDYAEGWWEGTSLIEFILASLHITPI